MAAVVGFMMVVGFHVYFQKYICHFLTLLKVGKDFIAWKLHYQSLDESS